MRTITRLRTAAIFHRAACIVFRSATGALVMMLAIVSTSAPAQARLIGTNTLPRAIVDINPNTGIGTQLNTFGPNPTDMSGVAYDVNTNTYYSVDAVFDRLYSFDPDTGVINQIGSNTVNLGERSLAFDPNTSTLYMSGDSNVGLYTVNTTTGVATHVGGSFPASGMAFDPNSNTLYAFNSADLFTINTTTGAGTAIGTGLGFGRMNGLTFGAIPVECPADFTGDDQVNIDDIFAVLGLWGTCPNPCPPYCTGDLTEDCTVNIDDIFAILGMWGPCE